MAISGTSDDELAAIEATAISYLTAFNRADAAAVVANYADDGVLMAPARPAVVGKDMLTKVYPQVFEAVGFDMTYDIKEVVRISAEWAFVRSATEGIETNKATGEVQPAQYQELFVLRRSTRGTWQIARYCTCKIASVS
ncbi:YybH family protein [Rhizobium leguminosarum]